MAPIEPPLTPAQEEQLRQANAVDNRQATAQDAEIETRTVMCVTGKLIRKSFERQMLAFAQELGLQVRDRRASPPALHSGRVQRDGPIERRRPVRPVPEKRSESHR